MVTANLFWEYIRLVAFILMSRQYMIGAVYTVLLLRVGYLWAYKFRVCHIQAYAEIVKEKRKKNKFLQLMDFNLVIWNDAKKLEAFLGLPS